MRYLTAGALQELEGRLSERDWSVVRYLASLHFVSGHQLTRLSFAGDVRAARRSLLRLTRLGLLERLPRQVGGVRAGSAGSVYHLGLAGQALATARGWQPERRRRRSSTPGTLFLQHSLLIAELHTLLVEADRSQAVELLALTAEPACWRSFGRNGNQGRILKPDSYLRLGVGDFEDSYFLEIDRGTEGTTTLVRQLTVYTDYFQTGQEQARHGVFPRVLWLTLDERRVRVIADCVAGLAAADRQLFVVAQFQDALGVIAGSSGGES